VNQVEVQSIAFGGGMLEITYFEPEFNEGQIHEVKTLLVPTQLVEEQVADLTDSIVQLIDELLVMRRNPPSRIERARR
jgi:hypothetical protein